MKRNYWLQQFFNKGRHHMPLFTPVVLTVSFSQQRLINVWAFTIPISRNLLYLLSSMTFIGIFFKPSHELRIKSFRLFIIPFAYYLIRHWNIYQTMPMNHYKFTGYILLALSILLIISGVVLTYQGALQTKISKTWDLLHIIGTFVYIDPSCPGRY